MVSLVTGGRGFLGRKLSIALQNSGVTVRSLSKTAGAKNDIACNLGFDSIPDDAFHDVDTIFHLAGISHDTSNLSKNRELYYRINVEATIELARLAEKNNVDRFIFISSVKAGGHSELQESNDKIEGAAQGLYGETKRKAELELLKIGQESDMHVFIVRPSLVYGPDVKGNLQLMLSGIESGWFPSLPETGNKRSMVHVDDLVEAILLIAGSKHMDGEIFIVTDGIPYSSRMIYNAMRVALGKPESLWSVPKFIFNMAALMSQKARHKINKLLGDEYYSSKKIEALGFRPKKTLKDINSTKY